MPVDLDDKLLLAAIDDWEEEQRTDWLMSSSSRRKCIPIVKAMRAELRAARVVCEAAEAIENYETAKGLECCVVCRGLRHAPVRVCSLSDDSLDCDVITLGVECGFNPSRSA